MQNHSLRVVVENRKRARALRRSTLYHPVLGMHRYGLREQDRYGGQTPNSMALCNEYVNDVLTKSKRNVRHASF